MFCRYGKRTLCNDILYSQTNKQTKTEAKNEQINNNDKQINKLNHTEITKQEQKGQGKKGGGGGSGLKLKDYFF